MMQRNVVLALAVSIAFSTLAALTGCGVPNASSASQQHTPTPLAVVFVAAPPATLAVNASTTIDAATTFSLADESLSNDDLVTYSIHCASTNACGTLSASNEVGATVYKAPPMIPSGPVTITATSIANPSLSASANITIVPPIPISVAAGSTASLQVNTGFTLRALIENNVSTNPQVAWSVTCAATACGSFSSTPTTSDGATTYTAPSTVPTGNNVTVTATSITDPTKSDSHTITILPAAPTLADGTYVFSAQSSTFVTGVFTAHGGAIISGEMDAVSYSYDEGTGSSTLQSIQGGSYSTTPAGNLQIDLSMTAGGAPSIALSGRLTSNQKGFISGIDGAVTSGTLELQTSTAPPAAGFAFSLNQIIGVDGTPSIRGVVNVDSAGGISGNGSVIDAIYGSVSSVRSYNLAPSTVSAPDAFGRVVFQWTARNSELPPLYVAGYMVDATHIRLTVATNPNSGDFAGVFGGLALGQGANTGTFSAANAAGTSYIFGAQGEDTRGQVQVAGVLTLNTGGTVSGTLNWNDLSAPSAQNPIAVSGSYTVDATGRVTIGNLTGGSAFTEVMHLYLDGRGGGLLLSTGQNGTFAGQVFQQQPSAFSTTSFSGNYGFSANLLSQTFGSPTLVSAEGPVTVTPAAGTDAVAGFADLGGPQSPSFAISGNFAPSANGVFAGSLIGFDSAPVSSTPAASASAFTLYMVDSTQGVAIETDHTQLALVHFVLTH